MQHPTKIDKAIGKKIRTQRILAGRTLAWLAKKMKLTSQQISNYESAENKISISKLYGIAAALKVKISELLP